MSLISNENYVNIQGWMINELNLSGNSLLVYAIIYGFSQDNNTAYSGSLQYLADWCGATKQGVQKNLKDLLSKNLIVKKEINKNGVKFCEYSCIVCNKVAWGMQQSCTNNIEDTIDKELKDKVPLSFNEKGKKKFTPPTVDEVAEYCRERDNGIDAEAFVSFYQQKNWYVGKNKMVDWKASVRYWERNRKSSPKSNGREDYFLDFMKKEAGWND